MAAFSFAPSSILSLTICRDIIAISIFNFDFRLSFGGH
jgi:hypothetical protein